MTRLSISGTASESTQACQTNTCLCRLEGCHLPCWRKWRIGIFSTWSISASSDLSWKSAVITADWQWTGLCAPHPFSHVLVLAIGWLVHWVVSGPCIFVLCASYIQIAYVLLNLFFSAPPAFGWASWAVLRRRPRDLSHGGGEGGDEGGGGRWELPCPIGAESGGCSFNSPCSPECSFPSSMTTEFVSARH